MNVLVVDDEPEILKVWQALFKALGVTARTAANGELGIEAMRHDRVDLLITDLRMPVADGFQVLEYAESELVSPPLMFVCSGFVSSIKETALDSFQIERVIPKPFAFKEELRYFRALLAERESGDDGG